jgi:hypothetical protein
MARVLICTLRASTFKIFALRVARGQGSSLVDVAISESRHLPVRGVPYVNAAKEIKRGPSDPCSI